MTTSPQWKLYLLLPLFLAPLILCNVVLLHYNFYSANNNQFFREYHPHQPVYHPLAIYWINLDKSKSRFIQMENMFREGMHYKGWPRTRIPAADTVEVANRLAKGKLLMTGRCVNLSVVLI
jgi:hypothetical protein